MEAVIKASHAINNEPIDLTTTTTPEPKKPGRPKKTTTHVDDAPTPPPTPTLPPQRPRTPPPTTTTKQAKVTTEKTKEDKEKHRATLIKKIKMYKANRKLANMLVEIEVPWQLEKCSDAELEGIISSIYMALEIDFRETQVRSMFSMAFMGVEKACSMFIHDVEWTGLAASACEEDNIEGFEPELSQVAIELSDSLIPDPKWRLAFKMFNFATAFRKAQLMEHNVGNPTFGKGNIIEKTATTITNDNYDFQDKANFSRGFQ